MTIPPLNEHGHLPAGICDCTFSELVTVFGQNQWIEDTASETRREVLCRQRSTLCDRLEDYLARLRDAGLPVQVLVDGSFVTGKPDPGDIDLIVVLPADHDFTRELNPRDYNLLSKKRLRASGFPFDVFVVANGDSVYLWALDWFQKVRGRGELRGGLLRVKP